MLLGQSEILYSALQEAILALLFCNAVVNIIVYSVMDAQFRKYVMELVFKLVCWKHKLAAFTRDSSRTINRTASTSNTNNRGGGAISVPMDHVEKY